MKKKIDKLELALAGVSALLALNGKDPEAIVEVARKTAQKAAAFRGRLEKYSEEFARKVVSEQKEDGWPC